MSEKKIYFMHELPEAERYAMSESALREEAIKFERQNDPKEYRRMRSEGTLDEYATVERALVLAESDAAEPLEREPLWIPGTDYRADCAVGQLRPWGMRPCSDEPFYRRLLTRFNDRPELCRQHTYPTDAECRRRALRCLVRAHEWTAEARVAESEPRRDRCLDVAAWFQGRGELYRRYLRCGLTAAGVEWEPVRFDAVLAVWDTAVATDSASTEREPAPLAAD